MLRVAIVNILLFLLPFAAFALYLRFGRRVDTMLAGWSTRALIVCTAIAVVLVAGSLFVFAVTGRGPTTGAYVPPVWKDGVMVPGHIE
ncbi:DUF6111 family protein [Ancylobacter pratisalsi]|uniref:Uncharacterized protein n=1 Tax=Ancylobacter pratisalsi TaxID=1745854 RepID=A0A6P1YHK6_9HYPH|nr:DUF6111 family protein [Ancylobacter pratisalsi]QIB32787.1 hypothetical protein G3A50_02995 [Ancylobacter pratisalsi]